MTHPQKKVAPLAPADRVDDASFAFGATTGGQFPGPTLTEVAFAGRSNVGKSSLMNSLTGRKGLVRTSSTPGCTRQVSWFHIRTGDGAEMHLVDLPGYGYAKRSRSERNAWAQLIEGYLLGRPTLRGVVALIDIRRGLEQDDRDLLELLATPTDATRPPLQVALVATKLDKLSRAARKPALAALEKEVKRSVIGYSATEGIGRVALFRKVRGMAGLEAVRPAPEEAPSEEVPRLSAADSPTQSSAD